MKTALDWFIEKLEEEQLIFNHGLVDMWKKQAKFAEKEQMRNAFYAPIDVQQPKNFDDYYNETFKTE